MAEMMHTSTDYPCKVRDVIRVCGEIHADKPAILVKSENTYRTYTYGQLKEDVAALGTALVRTGLGGKKLLILGDNGYEWSLALLTALSGDFTAVPLDKTLSATDVAQLSQYTDAAAILYSDRYPEAVAALPEDVTAIPFSSLGALVEQGRTPVENEQDFLTAELDPDAPALLLLSQGASAAPRDVVLSGRGLAFTLSRTAEALDLGADDCLLSLLPLHHAYELVCGLLAPLCAGASVAFGEGLHAVMKNIGEVHPTVLVAAPVIAEALWRKVQKMLLAYGKIADAEIATSNLLPQKAAMVTKRKLFSEIHRAFGSSLRTIVCGGASTPAHITKGLRDVGFLALECYGIAECGTVATINPRLAPRYASVGKPLDDSLLDIYNKDENGVGEIRIKSEGVMLGYYKNDTATDEAIRDGWLYTGDLGYMDKDGYLFITGRKKNLLVRATGRSVFPEELEVLLMKEPLVKEAVVVGFINEQKRDYDLVAVIYPDKDRLAQLYGENYTHVDEEIEFGVMLDKINSALPDYKRLDTFILRDTEFEKTPSRKIRRAGVAASVSEKYLAQKQ